MATWIEEANKKIDALQALLADSHYQLSLEDLHLDQSSGIERVSVIRQELIAFRAQLVRDQQSKEVLALQNAIQDSLVAMTWAVPFNAKKNGKLICPYSGYPLNEINGIALSNGCIYHRMHVANAAEGHAYFPRTLQGSSFELSQEDIALAQSSNRINNISGGVGLGVVTSFLTAIIAGVVQWATGVSLFMFLEGVLISAGLAAGLAAGATVGLLALSFVAAVGVGAWLGARYHAKYHANEFEPVSLNPEPVKSSTALTVDQMMNADELAAEKKQNVELLAGEEDAVELKSLEEQGAESESTVESIEEVAPAKEEVGEVRVSVAQAVQDANVKPVEEAARHSVPETNVNLDASKKEQNATVETTDQAESDTDEHGLSRLFTSKF